MNGIDLHISRCTLLLLCLFFVCKQGVAQTTVSQSVIASGGGVAQGGAFALEATAGQAAIGTAFGGSFTAKLGFWYTIESSMVVPPSDTVFYTLGPDGARAAGDTVVVIAGLNTTESLCALDLEIGFDPAALNFISLERGVLIPPTGILTTSNTNQASTGVLNYAAIDTTNGAAALTGTGDLAAITFVVDAAAPLGPTPVSLSAASAGDCSGLDLPVNFADTAQVTVIALVTLAGAVLYMDINGIPSTPVEGIPIFIERQEQVLDSTVTDALGAWSFAVSPQPGYRLAPRLLDDPGRVADAVTPTDAFRVLNGVTNLISFTDPFQFIAADANNSNAVNATDAFVVFRLATGQVADLQEFGLDDWGFVTADFVLDQMNWPSAPQTIEIPGVATDTTGLDFLAGIHGDVTGSGAGLPPGKSSNEVAFIVPDTILAGVRTFDIPVKLQTNGEELGAFEFEIQIDTTLVRAVGYTPGSLLPQPTDWALFFENRAGRVYFAGFETAGLQSLISSDGVLVHLRFEVRENVDARASMPLAFTSTLSAGNRNGVDLAATGVDGQVVLGGNTGTAIEGEELPKEFALGQNYPNPFNPATAISFALPHADQIRIEVYDALGRLIRVLADGQFPAGAHSVVFEAGNLASGVYLYRLITTRHTINRHMVLAK